MSATWRNRIVGSGAEAPDQLLANPMNARIHPAYQQDALADVLDEVGWVQDVIVNQQTGHIIDGHLRVTLALRRGEPSVPVKYVELSPDEERLVLATFDPLAALAATDAQQMTALLDGITVEGALLQQFIDDLALGHHGEDGPPSLDALAAEYGDPEEHTFWPTIQVKVPPETHERYESLLMLAPGATDAERFRALLDAVDTTAFDD